MFIPITGAAFLAVAALLRLAPGSLSRAPRAAVPVVAALAAVGVVAAPAAPTGWSPFDVAARAVLAVALVAAGALAPRFVPLLATALLTAALVVVGSPALLLAGAALGMAAAVALARRRQPLVGAVIGGLVAQVVLRLEWDGATGTTAAVGAVVSVVLLVPALPRLPRRSRRPVAWATAAVVLVMLAGVVGGALAALGVVDDVDAAVASAERGIDLVSSDPAAARTELDRAATGFRAAEERLAEPWALPARVVPVLAQHVRAARTMAAAGADLATVARDSVEEADVDRIRPVDGRIDLEAVQALQEPLRRADTAMALATTRLAEVRSPWLVPMLTEKLDELEARIDDAAGSAELAAAAVDVLPGMLGGDGPRRYLLLLQQPAEARGSGGLPGNWGEITLTDGRMELTGFGRHEQLSRGGVPEEDRVIDMPEHFDALYGYDERLLTWQNVTTSPDFTDVAELARQLYPQSGRDPIDGVISLDPSGVAALLRALGPVELSDGRTLDAGNAEELLYFKQYVEFDTEDVDDGREERIDLLGDAAIRTWARATGGELPGPRALAEAFGPAVEARHVQIAMFDPRAQALLERLGLTGALPEPTGDGVGFATQNAGQNKIDWFLDRSATYEVTWDPADGSVAGTYRVTLANAAPAEGLPDYVIGPNLPWDEAYEVERGDNASLVYLYTALPPGEVRVDQGLEAQGATHRDGAWYVTTVRVRIPAGQQATIEVDVAGAVPAHQAWSLDVVRQPAINGDELEVRVAVAGGWALDAGPELAISDTGATASLSLDEPVRLGLVATPLADGGLAAAP